MKNTIRKQKARMKQLEHRLRNLVKWSIYQRKTDLNDYENKAAMHRIGNRLRNGRIRISVTIWMTRTIEGILIEGIIYNI